MTVMQVYYQRRAMKISRDLTVLGTTQTQGKKLLCAAKHVQYETRRSGWKQCISEQRGSISQGAWQVVSAHPQPTPCHVLYWDHSKLKKDLIQKKTGLSEKSYKQFTVPTSYITVSEQQPPMQDCRTDSLTLSHVSCHHAMFWCHRLILKSYILLSQCNLL